MENLLETNIKILSVISVLNHEAYYYCLILKFIICSIGVVSGIFSNILKCAVSLAKLLGILTVIWMMSKCFVWSMHHKLVWITSECCHLLRAISMFIQVTDHILFWSMVNDDSCNLSWREWDDVHISVIIVVADPFDSEQ